MLEHSTRYTRRCVEQLTFLPSGGQRWTRSLQIQLPEDSSPPDNGWYVVPLGLFARRRFADFVVSDASGTRINLLTRRQHGSTFSRMVLAQYVLGFLPRMDKLRGRRRKRAYKKYKTLCDSLYELVTSSGVVDADQVVASLTILYVAWLSGVTKSTKIRGKRVRAFAKNVAAITDFTQYLCWIEGEPGQIVNLQVCYTTEDEKTKVAPRGSLWDVIRSIWHGIFKEREVKGRPPRERREVHRGWYRQFGLGPLDYEFNVPSQAHTGSYYFTLERPPNTDLTYLDWQTSNSIEDTTKELDCALPSVHVHNDEVPDHPAPTRGRTIRAYLRCTSREHKRIAAGALLNVVFVCLIAKGSTKISGSAQTWLLVTPTVLTAYIADQQRHYYANATRRQRGTL
jgi:hypothetical protein